MQGSSLRIVKPSFIYTYTCENGRPAMHGHGVGTLAGKFSQNLRFNLVVEKKKRIFEEEAIGSGPLPK